MSFLNEQDNLSAYILKKTKKEITSVFLLVKFTMEKEAIQIPKSNFLKASDLFKIKSGLETKGYALIASAPSKTDVFDYLLLFDINFKLKKIKVLVYRENYGGEIASKRWLAQFVKSGKEFFIPGDTISAISGATISVQSLTSSINHVMKSLKKLKV
jgi:hypothetical protein